MDHPRKASGGGLFSSSHQVKVGALHLGALGCGVGVGVGTSSGASICKRELKKEYCLTMALTYVSLCWEGNERGDLGSPYPSSPDSRASWNELCGGHNNICHLSKTASQVALIIKKNQLLM